MDAYCERVGMGVLAEPLNAFSNGSFLLAAWAAWVLASRTGILSAGVRALIALAASVGVGSILWHTVANMLTLILDSVPILIFIMWFIWLYARNVIGTRPPNATAAAAAFLVATLLAFPLAGVLHGAPVYTPGLIVTLALGVFHARERGANASPCSRRRASTWRPSSSARSTTRSAPSCRSAPTSSGTS